MRGVVGRVLLVAVVLAAALAPAAGAVPAQAGDDGAEDDQLSVLSQTAWVPPGGTFALRVRIEDAPAGAELRWSLHAAVRNRTQFAQTLEGDALRSTLADGSLPLDALGEGASAEIRIPTGTVTGEEPVVSLGPDDEGVYPVEVELIDDGGDRVDRLVTHLLRLPDPDPEEFPLDAAVVLPLHAPPSHVAPGEVDTSRLARLDVAVDALVTHPEVPLTLAPTPEAVAAADETDPAVGQRLALAAANRQVLASTWVRVDEASWRAGGLAERLRDQRERGEEALVELFGSPVDTTTAVIPEGGLQPSITAAAAAGARLVVVPESDLAPLDGDDFLLTLTRPFEVPATDADDAPTVRAVMADAALAAHAGSTGDPVLDAHHLLADLSVLALDAPAAQRMAVAVLDEEAAANAAFLDALLAGLGDAPGAGAERLVDPVTLDDAIAEVDPAADPDDDEEVLLRRLAEERELRSVDMLAADLASASAEMGSYRSVFGPDDPVGEDVAELIATSAAAALDTAERRRLIGRGVDALRAELDQIHGPPQQRVTFTAREGRVQMILGNQTGRPADVLLRLRGERLEFPQHPDDEVLVHLAEPTTRIDLAVRARSSGDAPLDIVLLTPDGRVELGRSRITVRTTAFSGVGLVLMGTAALFLVVWWTRTIVRERGSTSRRPAHARGAGD